MSPDHINFIFNMVGVLFSILSIVKARHDRRVAGIDIKTLAFFVVWNAWSSFYYFWLGQYWSGVACSLLTVANTIWLGFLIKFRKG